jgi:hypothetical protein
MSGEIIQSVTYDIIIMIFQHVDFSYFHKISFHYFFEDYLMTKTDLKVNLLLSSIIGTLPAA